MNEELVCHNWAGGPNRNPCRSRPLRPLTQIYPCLIVDDLQTGEEDSGTGVVSILGNRSHFWRSERGFSTASELGHFVIRDAKLVARRLAIVGTGKVDDGQPARGMEDRKEFGGRYGEECVIMDMFLLSETTK